MRKITMNEAICCLPLPVYKLVVGILKPYYFDIPEAEKLVDVCNVTDETEETATTMLCSEIIKAWNNGRISDGKKVFWDTEHFEIVTETDLLLEYIAHDTTMPNFQAYLNEVTSKNGTLLEVRA